MKKLAFYRLMLSVWHRLPLLLIYVLVYITATAVLVNFVTMQLFINVDSAVRAPAYDDPDRMKELLFELLQSNSYIYYCLVILLLLFVIWLISRRLPLSLPRALYACPADEHDKLRCLRYYLLWKALFLLLVLTAVCIFWLGTFLLTDPPMLAVQVSLTFFTLIAFSLNPDPGNRREALKVCPDMVTERSSATFVSVYWSALLLLENTVFYSLLCSVSSFTWADAAWWIPALLLNIYLARKHITPVLKTMLDYEKLYYPVEKE